MGGQFSEIIHAIVDIPIDIVHLNETRLVINRAENSIRIHFTDRANRIIDNLFYCFLTAYDINIKKAENNPKVCSVGSSLSLHDMIRHNRNYNGNKNSYNGNDYQHFNESEAFCFAHRNIL